MADDVMYLENLKEFVFDEERIVTYKWLSRTLSVNVNQAKQMLYAFIQQQQREKADSLCIIYTVGGLIKDNNGNLVQKFLFSHEKDLQDIKQCYDKITSLHVYSLQKTKPKDSNVLYLADYDLQKQNLDSPSRWSNITFKSIKKRTSEVEDKFTKTESGDEEKEKANTNSFQKQAQDKVQVKATSFPSTSTSSSTKNSKATKKPGDVASFFARQAASKNKETVNSVDVQGRKDEKAKEMKELNVAIEKEENKSKSMSVSTTVENEEKVAKDEKDKSLTAKKDRNVETIGNDDKKKPKVFNEPDEYFDATESNPNQVEKKSRKSQKQNKNEKENREGKEKSAKRKTSSKEENEEPKAKTQRKKRKRVKNFSDTSSEEEDNSVNTKQSNSSIDNTTSIPDQQVRDIKPEIQKARRRKKVLKSKTYLGDDGYMVTEKVYESESASSEDEQKKPEINSEVNTNKPALKDSIQPPKKKPANKATKQATLTSFFKRT